MTASAQSISLQFESGVFKVIGWKATPVPSKGWASVFVVYAGPGNVPPLAGTYAVENGVLAFHPTYPVSAGVQYHVIFYPPSGGAPIEKKFNGPSRDEQPSVRVEAIYPSGDVLPSNLLRLYLYFSGPMSRGWASQHIHLLDGNDKELPDVFLPGEELWDPNFDRLTMTFDPGRIKRGLTSNEKMGPPIADGKRYTLSIDRDWQDARGAPMVAGFRKSFHGGPAVRTPPDPAEWRLTAPRAGTSEPLIVDFPEPMNYTLLQRMLAVSDARGKIQGDIRIDRHEEEWRFVPRQMWNAGDYKIVVDTGIEDLAGNHIGQLFDIDTFQRVTEHIVSKTISLPFAVRSNSN